MNFRYFVNAESGQCRASGFVAAVWIVTERNGSGLAGAELQNDIVALLEGEADSATFEKAKIAVNSVFRDQSTQLQAMLLAISQKKIDAIMRLVSVSLQMIEGLESKISDGEIEDWSLRETVEALSQMTRTIAQLTASAEITKELTGTVQIFERNLAAGSSQRLPQDVKAFLMFLSSRLRMQIDQTPKGVEDAKWKAAE